MFSTYHLWFSVCISLLRRMSIFTFSIKVLYGLKCIFKWFRFIRLIILTCINFLTHKEKFKIHYEHSAKRVFFNQIAVPFLWDHLELIFEKYLRTMFWKMLYFCFKFLINNVYALKTNLLFYYLRYQEKSIKYQINCN